MASAFGEWRDGIPGDAIVTDFEFSANREHEPETVAYYGGYLVAESVSSKFKPLIKAAPKLLAACEKCLDIGMNICPKDLVDQLEAYWPELRQLVAEAKGQLNANGQGGMERQ